MDNLSKLLYYVVERNTFDTCTKKRKMSFGDIVIKAFVDIAAPHSCRLVASYVKDTLYFAIDQNIEHSEKCNIHSKEFPTDLALKIDNVFKILQTISML